MNKEGRQTMKEEICKHCEWYDKDNEQCTDDYDDIIPISAVVQCGEADKIIEEKLNNHSLDNNNTKEVKHGKSKEEEVL